MADGWESPLTAAVHLFHFLTLRKVLENMEEGFRLPRAMCVGTSLRSTKIKPHPRFYFCGPRGSRTPASSMRMTRRTTRL